MAAPQPVREGSVDRDASDGRLTTAGPPHDRTPARETGGVRDVGKEQAGARTGAAAQGKATDNGRGVDPANSDQANTLRAMMAARNSAPRQTPESMREALTAAKKAPGISRDQDYGAER